MPIFMFYSRRLLKRPLTLLISLLLPLAFTFGIVVQYQAAVTNEVWLSVADPDVHDAMTHMLDSSGVEWKDIASDQMSHATGVGVRLDGTLNTIHQASGLLDAEVVSTSSGIPAALLTLRLNSMLTTISYLAANTDSTETFREALSTVSAQAPAVQSESSVIGNENSTVLTATFNMVIFVMLLLVMTNVLSFLTDKSNSTTHRVLTTSRNKLAYYTQLVLVYAVLGALELGLMMAVMRYGFNLDLCLDISRVLLLFLAYILLNVFTICLGLLMVSRTTKVSTGRIMVTVVVLPMCMLSGTLWPSSVMPGWMQNCAAALPPNWVVTLNEQFFSGLALDRGVILLRIALLIASCGALFALLSRVRSDNI